LRNLCRDHKKGASIGAPDNNPLRRDGDKFWGSRATTKKSVHLVGQGGDGLWRLRLRTFQVPNQMSAVIAIAQIAIAMAAFSSAVNGMMETLIKRSDLKRG
jgi:hypothetical protein